MDNRELARALLEAVGADNVTDAVHCMTRLRITVRAVTATKEQLQRLPGVKGVLFPAAGQIHVVLGPGKAAAVTAAFNELRHGAGAAAPAARDFLRPDHACSEYSEKPGRGAYALLRGRAGP